MKYYGFTVCLFDGTVEEIEVEADFKPSHESVGMGYAKWFKSKKERDTIMDFTKNEIHRIQILRRLGLKN